MKYNIGENPFKAKDGEKTCDTCTHFENCKELNQGSDRMLRGCRICKNYGEKQIEEMAIEIAKRDCNLFEKCPKEPKHNCLSQEPAIMLESSKNYITIATWLYKAGYRNCKDKVVLTEREHEIAMKNQYDVGFSFGYKKFQEELKQASELKSETIRLAKQETAREIISKMKKYRFHKGLLTIEYEMLVNDLAKQYGVEVE